MQIHESIDTHQKALSVNLDARRNGTFAEIGAGQEVVRWFFRVGGGAGTIAKSMSACDMKAGAAIYGRASRYVCRDRLQACLITSMRSTATAYARYGATRALFLLLLTQSPLAASKVATSGRRFKNDLKICYPVLDQTTDEIGTCENLHIKPELQKRYGYLLDRGGINHLGNDDPDCLRVFSHNVLQKIKSNDAWEQVVPPSGASVIKDRKYFNFQDTGV